MFTWIIMNQLCTIANLVTKKLHTKIVGYNLFLKRNVVKVLCYKLEGRGFETRWGEWFLSIYLILPAALGPGLYSASNRN
jgi:hypothetical protein